MKQKTAVEYIQQEFLKKLTDENHNISFDEIIEKAKQIEQYQIVTAFDNGFFCGRELETDDEGRNYFKYVYYTKPGNRGN